MKNHYIHIYIYIFCIFTPVNAGAISFRYNVYVGALNVLGDVSQETNSVLPVENSNIYLASCQRRGLDHGVNIIYLL